MRAGPQRALPALARDLEPGVHGVRPAAPTGDASRCRSRAWTPGMGLERLRLRPPGRRDQLRHGPVHAHPRPHARAAGPRPRRVRDRSASATRSSRTTRGPSRSSSPTACCRPTRGAATSCGGSSVARCATAACSGARSRSWRETAAVVIDTMSGRLPHTSGAARRRSWARIVREETAFARTLDAGTVHLEEALIPLTGAERVVGRRPRDAARGRAGAARATSPSGCTTPTASPST